MCDENIANGNLYDTIKELRVHDHICMVYETKEEQLNSVVPFIKIGLERGEKCIYVVDDNTAQVVLEAMQKDGIDTELAIKAGSLNILTKEDTYLKPGYFDSEWMLQYLKETVDSAKTEGFKALRVTAEATLFLEDNIEKLKEYEVKVNSFFPENDILAICQYNRNRFSSEIILHVIHTHPIIIYGNLVCKNAYYILPEELLKPNQTDLKVKRLLNNISGLSKVTEKRSSSWIEYSPVCTKIVDLDFNLQYMSSAGIKDLKIDDITQLYGKPYPFDFYPEPFRNLMAKNLDKVKKTGDVITQEASVVDIEGNKLWYNSTLVPVNDDEGRIEYIMIVSIDTTERHKAMQKIKNLNETLEKRVAERTAELAKTNEKLEIEICERKKMEERLKDSLEQSRIWLDNSPVCTKVVDLDFNLLYMSAAGIKALKIDDVTTFYGKPYPFDFFPESTQKVMNKTLKKVKETGGIITGEAPVCDIEGNELWFQATFVPVRDVEGRIDFIIVVSVDINERKKMEEELIKMHKLESVGILAGGIAHDFNNYLQRILSNIELAKSYADSNDKNYVVLGDTERTVIQAKDLTQQLLTFSKGGEPIKEIISVSRLIKDSANFALSGTKIRCEFDIPDNNCLVEADKGQMNQAFNNLFINSKEAMPEGGLVKIWVESINDLAKEPLPQQERRYVKITIKDHGIGIPQDKQQKIFDPYFTTKPEGSGLGLAITYSIIKKHSGYITVESEMGVGTTFYIYIPILEKEISGEPVPNKAESSRPELAEVKGEDVTSLAGKKILFMDDDAIIKLAVVIQLKSLQCEVEDAKDGTEAIELYKKAIESGKPFDAAILDLTVTSGMGGKEAIKELHKIDIDIKAIVASGYSNDPIMNNFGKYGFKGMVKKPYRIRDLEKVLQKVIMEKVEP